MSVTGSHNALKEYQQVGTQSSAAFADPHRLIQMLLEGALDKIAKAKGHMQRGEIAEKGRHISWAISIIGGLRASLDMEKGGEIAQNLDALYDYIERRLLEANLNNDAERLDESMTLLHQVKAGWDRVPDQLKKQAPQGQPAQVE